MFLHLRIPGFHAAVHQAIDPALRGRAVAVAIDAAPTAALVATSVEARAAGVWPGLRADHGRRRCPGLMVVVQEPERYLAAGRCVAEVCAQWTPQVAMAGAVGRCDVDLAGTDTLWRQRLGMAGAAPEVLAACIAGNLRQRCRETLRLTAVVGVAARLVVARLAASLASDERVCADGVMVVAPGREDAVDGLPMWRLHGCAPALRSLLADCGIGTIGRLRALSAGDLGAMAGPAGEDLHRLLHGADAVVAAQADAEAVIAAGAQAGVGGAGPERARAILAGLAREIGWTLRLRQAACGRLVLSGRWLDGRTAEAAAARAQAHHDADLAELAGHLLERIDTRRVHWQRLRLTATRLGPVEDQQRWSGPIAATRLEIARDRIRKRFGADLVRAASAPADLTGEV